MEINVKHPVFFVCLEYPRGCPRKAYIVMDGMDYQGYDFGQIGLLICDFIREYPYPDGRLESFRLIGDASEFDKGSITRIDVLVESEYKPYIKE